MPIPLCSFCSAIQLLIKVQGVVFYEANRLRKIITSKIHGNNKTSFHNGEHAEQKALKYIISKNIKKPTLVLFRIKINLNTSRISIEYIDICNWCGMIIQKYINNYKLKLNIYTIKENIDIYNTSKTRHVSIKRAEFMNRPSSGDLRSKPCPGCKRCKQCTTTN